ncbi:MAG: response regulator [Polyangiales bacterium]
MPTLLLIEDEENERITLERILVRSGFEVEAVGGTADARAAMDRRRYDAVVSDVFMPGCDGLGFAREIAERCPGVPLVLMSAFPFPMRQVERLEIPRLRFLAKPVGIDTLLAALRNPEASAPMPCVQLPSMRRRTLSPR